MSHESNEPGFRVQQKGPAESEPSRKGRFGNILKENPIKGFNSETLTRPLTGLFRKTGKSPKRADYDDAQEPTVAAPPTNFPNMARISATIESVQINDEYGSFRDRNPETGSKLTLSDGAVFGNAIHPLTRYFNLEDVDISILGRSFPTEKMRDEEGSWTAQSLFNNLESRIKKERIESKDHSTEPRTRSNRDNIFANQY
ncbi:hypothetical protein GCK72_006090 [Caenorhabditis remanei]|uniref:Uncharacterized protein n=1 Tax=Caenorhabditis remanei TaxID=31234 RepID=A0A6A5HHK4_CAERE|nr:hypothetical protein GCK72_006090 [Caenorhabditis remanei]KAF1766134.1 hypothetical protein GCK72_006090 [Caenorhabditis remanei]